MGEGTLSEKLLLTGILSAGTALWGYLGWLAVLWCVCMATDYLTGTLAAMKEGAWSSAAAREGLWHKGGMLLVVCCAALTDAAITLMLRSGLAAFPFDGSVLVTVVVLAWYTLTELGSILENASRLTDRVPPWLLRFLAVARSGVDGAGEALTAGQKGGSNDAQQPQP